MRTRVHITVELQDEPSTIANSGQTVRWNQTLLDDEPGTTSRLLANALSEALTEVSATVARLRGERDT